MSSQRVQCLDVAPGAPAPTRTAVVALVAVADSVVGPHRDQYDTVAAWGVPDRVTILYPFVEPTAIDDQAIATVAAPTCRRAMRL